MTICYEKGSTHMVFSSIHFLFYFLPLVLIIYFLAPGRFRNFILLIFSLFFYAWGEPVYVLLMLFSILIDFFHGQIIAKYQGTNKARAALISSVIINLGLLGIFKYSDFLLGSLNQAFGLSLPLPGLALPIGISFYTFQTMSYSIDVYRGEAKVQQNIIDFGTFVTLFPQLIAGPIVRYQTVAEQLNERSHTCTLTASGIRRFIIGLGKKVLLANSVGLLWTQISQLPPHQLTISLAWLGIIAFAFQIYFDFSGYSDMAIGLGRIFGFTFLENFLYPYMARSITAFWQTWHISLGTWFKEYVYIPLGGNRRGIIKQLRNIAIVWLLTGIWHGASWNFLIWGAYYCIILIAEKLFLLQLLERLPRLLTHLYTLLLVLIGWVIFAFDSYQAGIHYLGNMFVFWQHPLYDRLTAYFFTGNFLLLIILIIGCTPLPARIGHLTTGYGSKNPVKAAVIENTFLITIFILSVAYLVDSTYNPFLYFRF